MTGGYKRCITAGLVVVAFLGFSPSASAEVLLGVADGDSVTVMECGPKSLKVRYRVPLPENHLEGLKWVKGHQLVGYTSTDMELWLISKAGAKLAKLPPKSAFKVPNPDFSQVPPERRQWIEPWDGDMGIVVREGEVWVHKCEWIDQSDTEDPCAAMARIRVWPSFKKAKPWISAVYALVPAKPKWKLPTVAPKDCQATARESQGRKRNRHEVACHCKGEKPQAIEVCEDTAYNPSTSVRWLAPRTLLIEADDCDSGSSEYRSLSLAKACHPESLKDVHVQAGP